jgi:integrase
MMRRKHQVGYVWRVKGSWYGRWYRDEFINGSVKRVQHSEKLCDHGDRYRVRGDVLRLLAEKVGPVNEGRSAPEGTLTVTEYFRSVFLPYAKAELKPSTASGYASLWELYLVPHIPTIALRDFRCKDATDLLAVIHRKHGLSKKSLRHCKGLLSSIFTHARQDGAIDGQNPIEGARIPNKAKDAPLAHAYSTGEVTLMLNLLTGVARTAVGLIYFCGLRPGEARGARWSDYDAENRRLEVKVSVWEKHEGTLKTAESSKPLPVGPALARILSEAERSSEFILAAPSGKPINLHNLAARDVRPVLKLCSVCHEMESEHTKAEHSFELDPTLPRWQGWYALRRGLGTIATKEESVLAAKGLLRHKNIATTMAHYIKDVPSEAIRAADKISALFPEITSSRPN